MKDIKRQYKDTIFTHLFSDKKYVLQLYNALHPEETDITEEMIDIVTLENVVINNQYNDLGFTVRDKLVVLVEAQSTWSVSIAVRMLLYLSQTYKEYIDKKDMYIYGNNVAIPKPELYVVYTGSADIKKDYISLAEEFFGGDNEYLDVKLKVIQDNNYNDIISQYITFSKIADSEIKKHGSSAETFKRILDICRNENILKEYLISREKEVLDIMNLLFDSDRLIELYGKEQRNEGRLEGRLEGKKEGKKEGILLAKEKLIKAGYNADDIEKIIYSEID